LMIAQHISCVFLLTRTAGRAEYSLNHKARSLL